MLKNYLLVALRNLRRSKGFSFINILGLSIGMASALLILLWVQNEWSYDRFFPKADRIYVAWNEDTWTDKVMDWPTTPKVMRGALKTDYPEIEKATRANWDQNYLFSVGDKRLMVKGTEVDPDFLDIFSVPFVEGNARTALDNPTSIVITQSLAHKLFGAADALGKTVKIQNNDNFIVTGVIKDHPNNTQFDYEYLLPWSYMVKTGQDDSSWGNNSTRNYVLLKPNTNIKAFNAKISNITIKHEDPKATTHVFFYPYTRMHLFSNFEDGKQTGGRIEMVRAFALIAVFILVIACINFMNLSTARSERRAKEVGIRKTVGALRNALVFQFLMESLILAVIAGAIALIGVYFLLGPFNELTHKNLALDVSNPLFWLSILGFILFTGILAGSYPAFFLSRFRPVQVLKGTFKKANALVTPRKILVVVQFTFAILLIISTLIILRQVRYAQAREIGYNRNNLVYVMLQGDMQRNYRLIRQDLMSQGTASYVSMESYPITESWSNTWGLVWPGKLPGDDKLIVNLLSTDGGIVKTTGMTIVRGRDMDLANYPSDSTSCILNESCVKAMHMKNPIGLTVGYPGSIQYKIVGVVKDFILESPYDPIRPMVFSGPTQGWFNTIHVRMNPARSTGDNVASLGRILKRYNPEYPVEYKFADTEYEKKFEDERTTAKLAEWFAGLTIFISCLGLFALAAYMAEARVKEIGVRKVLGASVTNLATLLSRDFVGLVVISILFASPIAAYFMYKWLGNYKYHIHLEPWVFILSGITAIFIAVLTVSFQAIKAALASPVKSLRSE
jgi:ABC-type antimicrobial peptide transport system permease subunit